MQLVRALSYTQICSHLLLTYSNFKPGASACPHTCLLTYLAMFRRPGCRVSPVG